MRDHGLQTHHVDQADFSHEIEIYHRLSTKYSPSFGLHSSLVATSDYAHAVVITACRCQDHLSEYFMNTENVIESAIRDSFSLLVSLTQSLPAPFLLISFFLSVFLYFSISFPNFWIQFSDQTTVMQWVYMYMYMYVYVCV